MAPWSASDIPDQSARVAIVTGANRGLGYCTALELARHGGTVVMACRDTTRGAAAHERLLAAVPGADATVAELDLADLASVREFATDVASTGPVDILVNNAGMMAMPKMPSAEGFEAHLATNHLGHFALTGLLLPALLARPSARVVTVSSAVAVAGTIDFDDLQSDRRYNRWQAYAQSKLANLLFTNELARRADAAGASLIAVAAHPGYADTNLQSAAPKMAGRRLATGLAGLGNRLFAQSAAAGALPELYAATAPGVRTGDYVGPDRLFGTRGHPTSIREPRAARRPDVARRLWTVSEELTGVTYDFGAD